MLASSIAEPPSEGSATVLGCFSTTNASVVAAAKEAIRTERLRMSSSNGQWRDLTAHSALKEGAAGVKISFRQVPMGPVTQPSVAMVDHGGEIHFGAHSR